MATPSSHHAHPTRRALLAERPGGDPGPAVRDGPIRVFLLDGQEIVRRGVARWVGSEDDMLVVGEADTPARAVGRVRAVRPDVVVLDVGGPEGEAMSFCREVLTSVVPVPALLVLTAVLDGSTMSGALGAGASGCVSKHATPVALLRAVRTVAAGGSLWVDDPAAAKPGPGSRDGASADLDHADLTPLEDRVLGLLSEGLTNRQIGLELHLAEKTIKNHVTSILRTLGCARRTQAAVHVRRHPHETALAPPGPRRRVLLAP